MQQLEQLFKALGLNEGLDECINCASKLPGFTQTEMLKAYEFDTSPCPFKIDQFITPKKDGRVIGAGEPHRVMVVYDQMQLQMVGQSSVREFNMIVAQVIDNQVRLFTAISSDYEPYLGMTVEDVE